MNNVEENSRIAGADKDAESLPDDAVIVIAVRSMDLFPGTVRPLTLGRERSVRAAQEAARRGRPVGIVLQRDPTVEEPAPQDLYEIGVLASVLRYVTSPDGAHHLVCQGQSRFRAKSYFEGFPFLVARAETIEEEETSGTELDARFHLLKEQAIQALQLLPNTSPDLLAAVQSITEPGTLADLVTSFMDLKREEKQSILETLDVKERLDKVTNLVSYRTEVLRLSREIGEQTKESLSEQQREALLREQLRTIQKQLGEEDTKSVEIEEIRKAIEDARMPEEAEKEARRELKRLERMPEAAAEYGMIRTYLDWLTSLPWTVENEPPIDIAEARQVLDADHYGLKKIKKRILEHLAVRKLNPEGKSPILCFVGPPGVGKTSLGQSIARAMGRAFVRASLGGVHDEAEIRGHRRTYIGAMPGNVIQSIRKAGARNAVFMLDEMDKLGMSFRGDPSAALLEVLDPEQNTGFRDSYLGVPFDLSRVMFIGTANVMDTIPGPLRDRMEVIELSGYTESEKLEIAKRYLVGRQLEANGLKPEQCRITDEALKEIIRGYTREAGCRNLEREIGSVCRHVAMRVAEGEVESLTIDAGDLHGVLGARKFESEVAMRTGLPGVVTGLAWTAAGGDILFVEANRVPGSGKLTLTGQLGDVMKESAQAALSLVKARMESLGLTRDDFDKSDIHIHVPAGAIPKDGPSAGVTMFVALVSLMTGRKVKSDVAMTGEISLRGLVLPIGGIKEKSVAAVRAGIETVLLPERNRKDLEDVPTEAREKLHFEFLETVDDALAAALVDECDSEPAKTSAVSSG